MNLDALVVLSILIVGFPKWIMAVECGRRRYHDRYSDNPFTAAIRKPDQPLQCFAMLLLPHGRVFESDLLITSKDCERVFEDGYVAAFNRGYDKFRIDRPIQLEAHGLHLFELQNAANFTPYIQPICIPSGPEPIPRNGTTLRWTYVFETEAVVVRHEECRSSTQYKPSLMFCIRADDIHSYVQPGTPYFKEVNGVNTLWGLYAFRVEQASRVRHAFYRMVPIPEHVPVQMPGEQEYHHYGQYAPMKK